jgi:hypothetical protein
MGCVVTALAMVLSAATSATGDVEVRARAEGRSSTLAPESAATESRGTASVGGKLDGFLEGPSARASGAYDLQLSTLDVGAVRTPAVSQTLGARLELRDGSPRRAEVSVEATRARTEPLSDAAAVARTGGAQVLTTGAVDTESLRGGVRGDLALDRLSLGAGASASATRGTDVSTGAAFPSQWGLGVNGAATYAVTERDGIGVSFGASRTVTSAPEASTTSDVVSATATWQRRLTPTTQASLGAGLATARAAGSTAGPVAGVERRQPTNVTLAPAGDLALDHQTSSLGLRGWVRVATFVDRFTGSASPMASAGFVATGSLAESVTLVGALSGGSRLDGVSSFAALDAHVAWRIRPGLDLEGGVLGRDQLDRRSEVPSFVEFGGYLAISFSTGPLLGVGRQ